MEWLLIAALAVWIFFQGREQGELKRRLGVLERRQQASGALGGASMPFAAPPVVTPRPTPTPEAAPAETEVATAGHVDVPPAIERPAPSGKRLLRPKISIADWLSEHGLAWLGGGALALGGLFVATYAAQRGVFTPALRVGLAIVAGLAMLAASEWLRQRVSERGRGPAAALLAGAGAATLYGAIWASDRLYGFIGLPVSAPLLALTSAGLLALAFIHGMPLALVALFGAYLAPVVTDGPDWGDGPLTAYLLLILLTGYATAALRGWKAAAWAATGGVSVWAIVNFGDAANAPSAALLAASPAVASVAALWRSRRTPGADALPHAVTSALLLSSILGAPTWSSSNSLPAAAVAGGLWCLLVLLAAAAAGWRLTRGGVQVAVYGLAAVGMIVGGYVGHSRMETLLPPLAVGFGLIAAGLLAVGRATDARARTYASTAAVLAAFALTTLSLPLHQEHFALSWAVPALAAVLIAAVAAWLGRRVAEPGSDLGLALWIWSGTVLAARTILAGLAPEWGAPALVLLPLGSVLLHARLGWRGFGAAAIVSTIAALTALIGVGFQALAGDQTVVAMSLAFAAGTLGVWIASRLARRTDTALADALSTGAIVIGLAGLFLMLRLQGAGGATPRLEPLIEIGLGVVLLLTAGLMTMRGAGAAHGNVGRWRGQAFMLAGLVYGGGALLVALNPLWSPDGLPIRGLPFADSLAIAYLAPAILLAAATRAKLAPIRELASLYAGGATLFGLTWAGLELRRLFKGPGFAWGPDLVGRAEAASYALLAIAAALALSAIARRAASRPGGPALFAGDLAVAARGLDWLAVAVGAVVFGYAASPWWGPITRPFEDHPSALLLLALYAAAVAGWLGLTRRPSPLAATARVAVALQVFVLLTLAVRYGFRGLDMHTALAEARVETWAFSAIWAVCGVVVLAYGARRGDGALRWTGLGLLLFTTAKVLLFDMARLDGMIRAASFLAVGALLIAAALAARRFGGLDAGARREAAGV